MPRRRKYRRVPGLGLVPADVDAMDAGFEEDYYPERMGVPTDPRVAAWKSKVMKRAWKHFRSGRYEFFRDALRQAYREIPHPGGYRRRRRY